MANRFDERYEIRLAFFNEISELMSFINTYWKSGHILAVDRDFFEYEMVVDGKVNFLIAKTKDTGIIEGILGFLPCSRCAEKLDIWGVVWKTIPGAMPMLGMELKKRLMTEIGARTDLGVGANPSTSIPLLSKIYHYYTAKMKHYYRLSDIEEYKIAKIGNKEIYEYCANEKIEVIELISCQALESFFDFATILDVIPYKDIWYYNKRFYEHPIYNYKIWGVIGENSRAVIITRTQNCNNSSVVRIVDYIGEQKLFALCGNFFDTLLNENEYIDFYFDGFDEQFVKQAGFCEVRDDINIIPDYFNPFEQVNVDIYVDSSNNRKKCFFFKADGDQDRPN